MIAKANAPPKPVTTHTGYLILLRYGTPQEIPPDPEAPAGHARLRWYIVRDGFRLEFTDMNGTAGMIRTIAANRPFDDYINGQVHPTFLAALEYIRAATVQRNTEALLANDREYEAEALAS